jgi:asparagine synthetase B (glutamine-hydrolysing)
MAPKSFDPLRRTGLVPRYPYIEPPMLAVSAALSWDEKCAGGVAKAPLKALLARRAPPEWVYRPKHGFTPPGRAILSAPAAQEGLRRFVTDPGNPFQDVCNMTVIHRMTTLVRQAPLSSGVHDLLWVLLFTASWLDQVPATAPRPSGASLVPPTAPQTVGR